MNWIKAHIKSIVAFCGFVAAAITGVTDGGINGVAEWTIVAVALANAVNVYLTPNLTGGAGKFAKEFTAAVVAVGAALPLAAEGGLDGNEWVMLLCLVLSAFGVVLPNVGYRPARKVAQ